MLNIIDLPMQVYKLERALIFPVDIVKKVKVLRENLIEDGEGVEIIAMSHPLFPVPSLKILKRIIYDLSR